MIQYTTIAEIRKVLAGKRKTGYSIGFVPTMGALHIGHISLIIRAKAENDIVVSSIFVNPDQFNKKEDLINYPRTPENDFNMLNESGCDLLFTPSISEMYPPEMKKEQVRFDFGDLASLMEGEFRPGHFEGVARVVSRFFEIIEPNNAYFGEKDFQQLAIVRKMNELSGNKVNIRGCATIRTEEGLALSSRNIHLTEEELKEAPVIYKTILNASKFIRDYGIHTAKSKMIEIVENKAGFKVEYLEFVDALTLSPIIKHSDANEQRVCIAVLTSKTRLIDNVAL